MASYRPFPPPPPAQNPLPPPPPPQQQPPPPRPTQPQSQSQTQTQTQSHGNQYPPQTWGSAPPPPYPPQTYNQIPQNSNFQHSGYGYQPNQPPPPPPGPQQQYPFQPPPPPPPPDTSYQPPPPAPASGHQQYYPSSQYSQSQFNQQPLQPLQPPPPIPPPPPSSPPPSSSVPPPPPPPSSPPPLPPQAKEGGHDRGGGRHDRDRRASKEGNHHHHHQGSSRQQQQKPPVPPGLVKKVNGHSGWVETEEERRLRKNKEMEKQKQEERHKQQLKDSQNRHKPQTLASGAKPHGSISGSRIGERRAGPVLGGADRDENPLKRQTTFMCRMKFRNELPDPSAQPKLMSLKRDKDRFTRYTITSLEKMHKPKLYVEPDLGIPLDLLDLSVYYPPKERVPLAPEDEELLRDDELLTPLKRDGIKKKDRPSDQGVSWLVKTQYISPLSNEGTKQSLTEKQAKELREMREGRNFLENFNNRDRQIKEILASFEASKSRPVHATNKSLEPLEVLPLLPYFDRYEDQFVVANFDGEPTADSEMFNKMPKSVRDDFESKAVMKSFTASGSDPDKPERFLGYMVPSQDEVSKDIYDEDEDVSYSWVREYNWDVKGEDLDDLSTYLVTFDEDAARYLPLPTKLQLRKRRAKEGRSQEEGEQFVQPGKLTVRRRENTAVIERKEPVNHSYSRGGPSSSRRDISDMEEDREHMGMDGGDDDMGQFSGAEDYMSE